MTKLSTIEEAIEDIANGKMVILVDDEDRENEGDFVIAAECVTSEAINFMTLEGRGLICLAMKKEQVSHLGLEPMVRQNRAPLGTAFTQSIDLRSGGGVSARGRANTIRNAIRADVKPAEFVVPGYVFPLQARPGGVLVRSGQTEGSVDLARLAGLEPAGVICELMNPDGTMARLPELLEFGREHDMPVVTVADLIRYRLKHEPLVRCVSRAALPTDYGEFEMCCYENRANGQVHVALIHGDVESAESTLVRVHRADTVADVFGGDAPPSLSRLAWTLRRIAAEGAGVLLYLRSETPAMELPGLGAAVASEPSGAGASTAFHDFGVGAQILRDIGLRKISVMTNKPQVFKGLSGYDLEIVGWVAIEGEPVAQ